MAARKLITAEELRQILHYDPNTGLWRWAKRRPKIIVGQLAGYLHHNEYTCIEINGRQYAASRLAFLYMTGKWPCHQVDHRDMNKTNNRWNNLRDATDVENRLNRRVRADCVSGCKGVTKTTRKGVVKYIVRVGINGHRKYLGFFSSLNEATRAYRE